MGLVSLGVGVVTVSSSSEREFNINYDAWLIGVAFLTISLFLSSIMGIYQQVLYKTYGKAWQEGLFYIHFFSLPGFLLFKKNILNDIRQYAISLISIDILNQNQVMFLVYRCLICGGY